MGNEDSMVDDEEAPLTSGGRAPEPEPAPKTDYSQYASTYDPVDTSQADAPAPSYRSVTPRLRPASCVVDALRGSSDRSIAGFGSEFKARRQSGGSASGGSAPNSPPQRQTNGSYWQQQERKESKAAADDDEDLDFDRAPKLTLA